jgi:hypothetical protein
MTAAQIGSNWEYGELACRRNRHRECGSVELPLE